MKTKGGSTSAASKCLDLKTQILPNPRALRSLCGFVSKSPSFRPYVATCFESGCSEPSFDSGAAGLWAIRTGSGRVKDGTLFGFLFLGLV